MWTDSLFRDRTTWNSYKIQGERWAYKTVPSNDYEICIVISARYFILSRLYHGHLESWNVISMN